jgi:hypothetical protein
MSLSIIMENDSLNQEREVLGQARICCPSAQMPMLFQAAFTLSCAMSVIMAWGAMRK